MSMLERVIATQAVDVQALQNELAELRAQLAAARRSSQWTQALLTHLQAGVVVCSPTGMILHTNPQARQILGRDDLEGQDAFSPAWRLHHPDGRPLTRSEHPVAQVLVGRQPVLDCHLTVSRPDGALRWVTLNALPIPDDQGQPREVVITFLDLSHDEMAMRAAALARETMSRIVQAAPLGICVTDERGTHEQVNPHYCELYGYGEEELLGRHFSMVAPEEQRQALACLHDQFIREGLGGQGEWHLRTRRGEQKTILADAVRITGDDGRPRKVTFSIDISQRTRLEQALRRSNEELQHLAITDGLTGLYNRRHILLRLEEELHRAQRYGLPLCIFLFDLDHFKCVNDTHGHAVGDSVLEAVSAMLRHELRGVDLIARYGGEEFLVVLPNVDHPAALAAAERMLLAMRGLEPGVPGLRVTLSGGVVQALPDETAARLIQRADMCLYGAKGAGRDRIYG